MQQKVELEKQCLKLKQKVKTLKEEKSNITIERENMIA
jgi:hypothetical protein